MHISRLRNKLFLTGLLIATPFVVCIILIQIFHFKEEVNNAIKDQQEVAGDIAQAYSSYVEEILVLESILGERITEQPGISPSQLRHNLLDIVLFCPKVKHIAVADPNGRVIASNIPQMEGMNIFQFLEIKQEPARKVLLSSSFYMKPLNAEVFAISFPVQDKNRRLSCVISALVDEESIKQSIVGRMMNSGMVVITDSKGVIAVKNNIGRNFPGRQCWLHLPPIREALRGRSVMVEKFRMPSGPVVLGAVEPIREFNWAVGVFYPREDVVGPVRRKAAVWLLLTLLFVGIALGVTGYLGNLLSKPLLDLVEAARAFQAGDMSVRADVRTGDEIQLLGQSFNEMAATLQERTNELHEALRSEQGRTAETSTLYTVAQGLIVAANLSERLEIIARSLASFCKLKRCTIFLRRGDRLIASAGWGLIHPELVHGITIDLSESAQLEQEAILAGKPVIIEDITNCGVLPIEFINSVNLKGGLLLPLVRRHHVVGIAFLDNPGEVPILDQQILDGARQLADLAAIAIEHAMASQKQRNIAEALQSSMLPTIPSSIGVFSLACRYYPALEEAELGGDFYDLLALPGGRMGLVIADVAGKGLEAAVYTAMGKYTLRAFLSEENFPSSALTRTNNALVRTTQEWGFVTMFHGILDVENGQLVYSNAGHPPAILARESGEIVMLPAGDRQPPLGIFPDIKYVDETLDILPDEILVCYTDGIIEARRDGEQFSIERLASVIADHKNESPNQIADAIYESIIDFSQGVLQDDIALMVLKREQT
ncbi:MAG: SpoIIE family protein phosphatase [Armatimonadota bacterium]|nr:SpoIIE family protein phosphatase [Armatimonadota bacterium]